MFLRKKKPGKENCGTMFPSNRRRCAVEFICAYHSPIGPITLASDGEKLTGLWFDGQKYFAATLASEHGTAELPVFDQTRRWLDVYFEGEDPGEPPPLAPKGSAFRQAVWDVLLQIPRGETVTYGAIAKKLGVKSAQAVGGAVGHNPISILIPCHRVLGADGGLTGYAGGTEKKAYLLALEGYK